MASQAIRSQVQGVIHHEKQEQGSMLCAQHALNNLLQGHYFDAPQLAEIATQLDDLERSNLEMSDSDWNNREAAGRNADETGALQFKEGQLQMAISLTDIHHFLVAGFFSVSVLETALQVWGFSLLRWSSAQMRPYHHSPETQLAFILNLSNHWFCFRSFGRNGSLWFNLNSFLGQPEWVGSGYLGALLDQSQREGYSVFVVMPTAQDAPTHNAVLSQFRSTPADQAADNAQGASTGQTDEDEELQRAIQASMAQGEGSSSASGSQSHPPQQQQQQKQQVSSSSSSSGKRRKSRRQSDQGIQDALETGLRARGLSNGAQAAARRGAQQSAIQIDDDEDEVQWGGAQSSSRRSPFLMPTVRDQLLQNIADDDELNLDEQQGVLPGTSSSAAIEINSSDDEDDTEIDIDASTSAYRAMNNIQNRDYDDEDAELQRALAASLAGNDNHHGSIGADEQFDEGSLYGDAAEQARILEQIRQQAAEDRSSSASASYRRSPTPADVGRITKMREEARQKEKLERERQERRARGEFTPEPEPQLQHDSDDDDDEDEGEEEAGEKKQVEEEKPLSPEELRRMRLARFG